MFYLTTIHELVVCLLLITFSWIQWLFIHCPTHAKHSARSPNLHSTYLSYGAHLQVFFLISLIQQVLTKPQTIQISFNQWHRTRFLLFSSSFQDSQSSSKCLILLWILLHNWVHLSVTATYRASKFLPGTKVVTGDGKQIRDNPYPWRTQHFRRWLQYAEWNPVKGHRHLRKKDGKPCVLHIVWPGQDLTPMILHMRDILLSPFNKGENWGSKGWNNLPQSLWL